MKSLTAFLKVGAIHPGDCLMATLRSVATMHAPSSIFPQLQSFHQVLVTASSMCQWSRTLAGDLSTCLSCSQGHRRGAQQNQNVCAQQGHAAAGAPQNSHPGRGGQVRHTKPSETLENHPWVCPAPSAILGLCTLWGQLHVCHYFYYVCLMLLQARAFTCCAVCSMTGGAQQALRRTMEIYSNTTRSGTDSLWPAGSSPAWKAGHPDLICGCTLLW